MLVVTYAMQDEDQHDDVKGPGNGFVRVFDPAGHLLSRLLSRGGLNSPWGVALTPPDFGHASHRLLIGNFGDGRINAYELDLTHGRPKVAHTGVLGDMQGNPLVIDGLWAIRFPSKSNVLYFTAGPNDESDGLFGRLELP